ncbi:hypothetical protein K466DRAFT_602222 [Polyporus arcularius HHB13444]|uniref:Uncharacterized protein n=1 Tax=Polyporus arcularius HHB13444 TaxID=1314778 RepID=A0A5C3P6G4_9APHY|nr:hypothetical protein K466DRAFT_602222 [Polyporus arcularius HHB13444]
MQSRVSAPPRKPRPLKIPNQYSFLIVQSDPQDQKHGKGSPHWLVDIVVRESWVSRVPNTRDELRPNLQTASGAVAVDLVHSPSTIGGATEAFSTKIRTISEEVGRYDADEICKRNALRIFQAMKEEGHIMSTVTIALIEEAMRESPFIVVLALLHIALFVINAGNDDEQCSSPVFAAVWTLADPVFAQNPDDLDTLCPKPLDPEVLLHVTPPPMDAF